MGNTDKAIRVIIAAIIIILFLNDSISGMIGVVLLAVAAIFMLTSLLSFCPLYTIFGIKTNPKNKEK